MKSSRILAAAALAAALAVPAVTQAATATGVAPEQLNLRTRTIACYGAGELDGRLQLTVNANGIVNGFYIGDEGARAVAVTGGLQPDGSVWLEFGDGTRPRIFTGTLVNGRLIAYAGGAGLNELTLESVDTPAR